MTYQVRREDDAQEQLRRLSPVPRRAVKSVVRDLEGGPSAADTRQLRGQTDLWRARAGRWRIIFRLDDEARVIRILRVGPRKTVYDDLESLRR